MKIYGKISTAALAATMTITGMTPAFAANTVSPEFMDQALALKEMGLMAGGTDGDLMLLKDLTREEGITLLLAMFGLTQDANKLTDEETDQILSKFGDEATMTWSRKFVALAVKLNLAGGYTNGNFGAKDELQGRQFSKMIANQLGYNIDYNEAARLLMELQQGGSLDSKDQALAEKINATGINRDVSAYLIYRTLTTKPEGSDMSLIEVLVKAGFVTEEEAIDQGLMEAFSAKVSQTYKNKIEVSFTRAVTEKDVTFALKRNNVAVNVKSVTYSSDSKTAIIETSGDLQTGTYKLTVDGTALKTKEISFEAAASKVTKIEVLSDKMAIDGTDAKKASVVYKVYDQFGMDITEKTSVTVNGGYSPVVSNGMVTITSTTDFYIGQKVFFTIIYNDNTSGFVSCAKELEIGQKSAVNVIEIGELKNDDGKVLTTDTSLTDNVFYIPVTLKDQYGNEIKDLSRINDELIVSNMGIEGSFEKNADGNIIYKITKVPDYYGEYTMMIMSKYSAQSAKMTVTIAEKESAVSFQLMQPDKILAAGETIEIPYSAVNQKGEAITSYDILSRDVEIISSNSNWYKLKLEKDIATGNMKIKLTATADANTSTSVILTAFLKNGKSTGQPSIVTINAVETAEASTVGGFTYDRPLNVTVGVKSSFELSNFAVKDQYGRTFKITDDSYRIVLSSSNTNAIAFESNIVDKNTTASFEAKASGATTVQATLQKKNAQGEYENVSYSEYSFNMKAVEKSKISGYEISDMGNLYVTGKVYGEDSEADKYAKEVTIYGKTTSGEKVELLSSDIQQIVIDNSNFTITTDGKVFANAKAEDKETANITAYVLGADGATYAVSKQITASTEARKAAKFVMNYDEDAVVSVSDNEITVSRETFLNLISGKDLYATSSNKAAIWFEVEDQYGVESNLLKPSFISVNNSNYSVTGLSVSGTPDAAGEAIIISGAVNNQMMTIKLVILP